MHVPDRRGTWSNGVPPTLVLTARCSCAIAHVGVDHLSTADLAKRLFDKYRIWTVAIDGAGVRGVLVTPQLFTTSKELDALVRAVREIAR